jgi:hypothetical protein
LSGGDAVVVSIPKSGRTWLRTFLCAYFCARTGRPFTLAPESYGDPKIPRIIYSHDLFEQKTKADWWDRLRRKYLIPASELKKSRIILLVRDPRDAFVSHYVQLVHRSTETPNELKQKSLSEVLRDEAFGIGAIVATMNQWLREFSRHKHFTVIHYETLREKTAETFAEVLSALGERQPEPAAFDTALRFSDFGNMQKLEAAGAFDSKILQPGDVRNPESFKVRRGKVGGFAKDLSPEDQAFAVSSMRKLDARFGYAI